MERLILLMILSFVLAAPSATSLAAERASPQGAAVESPGNNPAPREETTGVIRGKLLKSDDRVYTVETGPGTQTDIRASKLTKFDDGYKGMQGDWIEAMVGQDGAILWLKKSAPGYSLEGDVFKADGDLVFVKDLSGKEVRLKMGKDTKVVGSHKVGERIRAEYTPDGQVLSIKPAKQMGGAPAAGP
jgi:hypothetical protein